MNREIERRKRQKKRLKKNNWVLRKSSKKENETLIVNNLNFNQKAFKLTYCLTFCISQCPRVNWQWFATLIFSLHFCHRTRTCVAHMKHKKCGNFLATKETQRMNFFSLCGSFSILFSLFGRRRFSVQAIPQLCFSLSHVAELKKRSQLVSLRKTYQLDSNDKCCESRFSTLFTISIDCWR